MSDGIVVRYRERLVPGPGWWLVIASLVAMISIAYGAALGSTVGVLVALACTTVVAWAVLRSSPVLLVTDRGLSCAGADLPREATGSIDTASGAALAQIRRGLHASIGDRAFTIAPAWAPGRAVVVQVIDPADPHTAWVVSTRHPDRLRSSLEQPG